jgi:hypothetical protein
VTGPEHWQQAEHMDWDAAVAWAAAAQVHATLAHAAAEAVGNNSLMAKEAWREVTGVDAGGTSTLP